MFLNSKIDFSQKQSNAWHYLNDKETTEVGFGGGAGGGKSLLGCVWHITNRIRYAGSRGLIGRAKISNLEQSTLITLFIACKNMGYQQGVDFNYNQQKHIITWANGSTTILKDLFFYPSDPDFTSLGSTEYTDVFIDEATEITEKAVDIVSSRIRWKLDDFNLIPKLLLTCNPSPGWMKQRFISDGAGNKIILKPYQKFIQALLTDNPDEKFRNLYESQLSRLTNDYDRQRLLYGDWDIEREILNAFATQYDQQRHESTAAVFDANKQLLISIDFNLNPFAVIFMHMFRDESGEHFHIFNESSIEHGSIPAMIDLIKVKYHNQLSNCILTGDAMGKRGTISERDNASHYEQLRRGLGLKQSQLWIPSNPYHNNSRADVNYVLCHFPDYKINPITCPLTCLDSRIVQCDAFGSIIKRNRKDLSQRADFLDCKRYAINTFLRKWIDGHMKQRN